MWIALTIGSIEDEDHIARDLDAHITLFYLWGDAGLALADQAVAKMESHLNAIARKRPSGPIFEVAWGDISGQSPLHGALRNLVSAPGATTLLKRKHISLKLSFHISFRTWRSAQLLSKSAQSVHSVT